MPTALLKVRLRLRGAVASPFAAEFSSGYESVVF